MNNFTKSMKNKKQLRVEEYGQSRTYKGKGVLNRQLRNAVIV